MLTSLLPLLRSPISWAVAAALLALIQIKSCAVHYNDRKQIEAMNIGLKAAYEHPRQESKSEAKRTFNTTGHLVVHGSGTVTELPGGGRKIDFAGTLTSDTTSHMEEAVATSSTSAPVLPPPVGLLAAARPPSRMIWAGWSVPEALPALGGSFRLLGPVWIGGWVRPGSRWDYGPTASLTF